MASSEEVFRLAAEVTDRFSGPLRAMQKQMHALSDELKHAHVEGSRHARDHAFAHGRLAESLHKVREGVTSSVIPAMSALGVTTLTVSGAIAGIVESVRGLGTEGRNLVSLSRQTKIATGELQALLDLGRRIGVPTDQMTAALGRVGDVLGQIKRGAPETLNALNQFSGDIPAFIQRIRDLKPLDQIKAIFDITTNPQYPVDQRKRLLAFFGLSENFADYLPNELAKMLQKAREDAQRHPINIKIAIEADEAFKDLEDAIRGIKNQVGVDFAPGLTQMLHDLTEWSEKKENVESIKSAFHEIAADALVLYGAVRDVVGFLNTVKEWGEKQKEKPPVIDLPAILSGEGVGRSTGLPGLGRRRSLRFGTPAFLLPKKEAEQDESPATFNERFTGEKAEKPATFDERFSGKSGKTGMMNWIREHSGSLGLKGAEWGLWGAGKSIPHLATMGVLGDLVNPALAVKELYDTTHSHPPMWSGDILREQRGGKSPRELLRKSLDEQYKTRPESKLDVDRFGAVIGSEAGKKIVEELKAAGAPGITPASLGGGGLGTWYAGGIGAGGGLGGGGGRFGMAPRAGLASLGDGGAIGRRGGMGEPPGGARGGDINTPGSKTVLNSKFGAPGGGGPVGEVGSGGAVALAEDRAKFAEELKNPAVRDRLAALTKAEVGNQGPQAQQAFTEMVMNFASSRKMPLADAMRLTSQGGMFPGLGNIGSLTAEDREALGPRISAAMGGSNVANFATGNASGSVGFNKGYETARHGGEGFGVEGPDRAWAERMRGAVGSPAAGGIDPHRMDPMAPAGAGITGGPYGEVTTASGRKFKVAAWAAPNFQKFVDSYEAAGGVLGPNTFTLGTRVSRSYHPLGSAMDLNQIGRGIRGGGVTLPRDVENRLAEKAGLWPGSRFGDAGHFEARNRDFAIAKQREWAGSPNDDLMKNARGAGMVGGGGAGKLEGDASLSIDLSGFPKGTRTKTKFGGLFKKVTLNRGRTMPLAGEGQGSVAAGEEEPPP